MSEATMQDKLNAQMGMPPEGVGNVVDSNDDQYLTFLLDNEEYGVDILRVQEIRGWDNVTRVPNMPEYIRGVLNLRGAIVPIVDLRMRFGLEVKPYGPTTVVVVLNVHSEDKSRVMGIVVDGVSEVYSVPPEQMKGAPDFGTNIRSEFIHGLATLDEKMVIVLDVDHLLNSDELAIVDTVGE